MDTRAYGSAGISFGKWRGVAKVHVDDVKANCAESFFNGPVKELVASIKLKKPMLVEAEPTKYLGASMKKDNRTLVTSCIPYVTAITQIENYDKTMPAESARTQEGRSKYRSLSGALQYACT